jgi:transcriptional regulator with XRE-family HTH domain
MSTKNHSSKDFFKQYGELSFAEMLRGFRLSDEYSQLEFAKKLGISAANLCDLEKGRKIPSAARAAMIAKRLGLPETLLIQLAIQDELKKQKFKYRVSLAA